MASVSVTIVQLPCIDAASIEGNSEVTTSRFSSMASSRAKSTSVHPDTHSSDQCPAPQPPFKHVPTASVPPLPPSLQQSLSQKALHKRESNPMRLQSQSPPLSPAIHPLVVRSSCSLSPHTPPVPKFASSVTARQCGDFQATNRFVQSSNVTARDSISPAVTESPNADGRGNGKLDACFATSPISKRKRSAEGIESGSTVPAETSRQIGLVLSTNDGQPPHLTGMDAAVSSQPAASGIFDQNAYATNINASLTSPSSAKKLCSQHEFCAGLSNAADTRDASTGSPVSDNAAHNRGSGNATGPAELQRRILFPSEYSQVVPTIPSSPLTMIMTPSADKYPRCVSHDKSPLQRSVSCCIMTPMGPPASPRSPNQLRKSGSFGVASSPRYVPLAPRIKASPPLTPSSIPLFHGSPVIPPVGQRAAKIFGLMGINACASPSLTATNSHCPLNAAPLPPSPLLTKSQSYSVTLSPGKAVMQQSKGVITRSLSDPRLFLTKDSLPPPDASQYSAQGERQSLPSPGGWALQRSSSATWSPHVPSQMASPFRQLQSPAALPLPPPAHPVQSPIPVAQLSPHLRARPSTSSAGCCSSPVGPGVHNGLGWVDRLSDIAKQKANAMSAASHDLTPRRTTLHSGSQPVGCASPAGNQPQGYIALELQVGQTMQIRSGCSSTVALAFSADAMGSRGKPMQGPPSSGKASPMGSRPLTGGLLNNLQPRLLPSSRSLQQVTDTHGTDQQQQPMRLQSSEPQQQQSKLQQEAQQKQNKLHANSGIQGDSRPLQPTEDLQQLQQKQQHQQCATANAHQPSLDHCHSYHYQQQQHQQSSYHQQQVQQRQPNPSTSQRSPQAELQDVVNTVPLLVNAAPACDSTSPHPTRAFSHMDCPVGMKKSESVCDSSATSVSRAPAPLPRASTAPTASHTANLDHYTSSMLLQQSSIFQGETDPCSEQHLSAPPGNFTNALPFGHGGILTNDHLTTGLDYMASPVDDMDGATWTDAGLATVQELELQELEVLEWLPDNDIGASGFFDHIDHGLDQAGLEGAITLANDDNGEQDVDEEEAAELEPQQFANSAAVSTDGTLHPVKLPEAGQDGAAFEPETKGAEMEGPAVEIAGWTAQGMPVIVEGETMGRGNGMSGSVNPGSASEAAAVVEDGDQGVPSGSATEQEEMACLKCTEDVQLWCPMEY